MAWTKVNIIHHLAVANAATRYLEICTPTTGGRYAEIDQSRFVICHRLMSLCPDEYNDGLKIDFRSAGKSIGSCVEEIARAGLRYDVILVDPWHEYETSMDALAAAIDLLADDGTIVVHDCLPTAAEEAAPQYRPGAWCGVTFKAYLDFLLARSHLAYCTIDTDYGCGLVRKLNWWDRLWALTRTTLGRFNPSHRERAKIFGKWRSMGDNYAAAYRFLSANRAALLNQCTVDQLCIGRAQWRTAG